MSGDTFYTPLQTKCYMLKNKGKNHSLLWIEGHCNDCEKPVSRARAASCTLVARMQESIVVRGADMWESGGRRPVAAEIKREIRRGRAALSAS